HDAVEQAAAPAEQLEHLVPRHDPRHPRIEDAGVVAVAAVERAALQEHGGDEPARPVARRQTRDAGDLQLLRCGRGGADRTGHRQLTPASAGVAAVAAAAGTADADAASAASAASTK